MLKLVRLIILSSITLLLVLLSQLKGNSIIGVNVNSPSQIPQALNKYTGVVYLEINESPCTGALLKGGRYILTAAHCVTENTPKVPEDTYGNATFKLPEDEITIPITDYFVHPEWRGYSIEEGNDIALVKLSELPPESAEKYDIYRNNDEVGKTFTKVGYGYIGIGRKGQDEESNYDTLRYAGDNRYDGLVDVFYDTETSYNFSDLVLGSQLLFDFDNGKPKNDVLGRHFPDLADTGLGQNEIGSANGDSGGPSFIRGKIAGITSWGSGDRDFFDRNFADIDKNSDNGSFGEFFSDTRVSFYSHWIDSIINQN